MSLALSVPGQLAVTSGVATALISGAQASGPILFATSANSAAPPGVSFVGNTSAGMGFDANQGLPYLGYLGVAVVYWSTSFVSLNIDPLILRNGGRITNPDAGTVLVADGSGNAAGFTTLPPTTSTSSGTKGSFAFDSGFIYVCTATNTWKRVALSAF